MVRKSLGINNHLEIVSKIPCRIWQIFLEFVAKYYKYFQNNPMTMWREAMEDLMRWHDKPSRKPLMVSGVRQCGKTYLIRQFGEENYENVLYVNLKRTKDARLVFEKGLDPSRILEDLSSMNGIVLKEGTSLIILDEIQACPEAITSLKYFCEEKRGYHIIAVGSLLGVPLAKKASYPVGKVDRLTMRPMNFREWLVANGRSMLYDTADAGYPDVSDAVQEELDREYRKYLFVGGMPEAVQKWVDTHDESEVAEVHDDILNLYASDFLKHVPEDMVVKVYKIWQSIPRQLVEGNGRFFYSDVEGSGRSRDLGDAVAWLESANLIHRVICTERPAVPLADSADGSKFKLYVCDCGLMSRMVGARLPAYLYDELKDRVDPDYRGAVAENFVQNEIVSAMDTEPFYWRKGKYEVDFLISNGLSVIPVEVKSGSKVRAVSLKNYIDAYSPEKAIILSKNPSKEGDVASVPLCMTWKVKDIADDLEKEVLKGIES